MKAFEYAYLSSLILLTGCSTAELPEDTSQIQEEWTKGIQRLGQNLTAVYPPSEEYQVGDVYGVGQPWVGERCPEPSEAQGLPANLRPRSIRLGTADLDKTLGKVMGQRYLLPNGTVANNARAGEEPDVVEPSLGLEHHQRRLSPVPLVAFPEFTLASGNIAKFGGTFGAGLFGLLFGGASSSDVKLEVKVKEGETYGLPVYDAGAALRNFCSTPRGSVARPCSPRNIGNALAATLGMHACRVHVTMVSRVYMTRSLQYTYAFSSAQAFQVAASPQRTGTAEAAKARAIALGDILGVASERAGASTDAKAAMNDLLAGLGADLDKLSEVDGNGGFVTFASYDSTGISLNQILKRPITFAYGGVNHAVTDDGKLIDFYDSDTVFASRDVGSSPPSAPVLALKVLPKSVSSEPPKTPGISTMRQQSGLTDH